MDNVHIELSLWDTAGQEEFDRLRSLSYGQSAPLSVSLPPLSHRRAGAQKSTNVNPTIGAMITKYTNRYLCLPADDTDLIMLCYSVDSKDSLENVESKWVGEIADNCPGVKLVLVALKCDLRESGDDDDEDDTANDSARPDGAVGGPREKKPMINYDQGLEVARRINAMRYLECSAMRNRGVNEAFTEAARVALSVKKEREDSKCCVM